MLCIDIGLMMAGSFQYTNQGIPEGDFRIKRIKCSVRASPYFPTAMRPWHIVDFLLSAVILFKNLIHKASSVYRDGKIFKSAERFQILGSYVTYQVLKAVRFLL